MAQASAVFLATTFRASAGVVAVCTGRKQGKQVASPMAAGLMMVKKSKKRNPT
ncbi:hypothetical protein [Hymenobacter tenuis]